MKLNKEKVDRLYSHGDLQFGFYKGGTVFMDKNEDLVNIREEAEKHGMSPGNAYNLNLREIIIWFIYKYCK